MRSDVNSDVFLSEVFRLRDELDDLGETVTDERLTTIILDALPEEMYSTVKAVVNRKYPRIAVFIISGKRLHN